MRANIHLPSCYWMAVAAIVLAPGMGWGAKPVGVVALVDGPVKIQRDGQSLSCLLYNHIYEGDRIDVGAGGSVSVTFRADGHVEQVRGAGIRTAAADGLTPKDGVTVVRPPSGVQQQLVRSTVGSLPGASLQGMVTFRSIERGEETRPVNGTLVDAGNLIFIWREHPEVKSYIITIRPESQEHPNRADDNRVVFIGRTGSHRSSLSGRSEFQPGIRYYWEVDVEKRDGTTEKGLANGNFLAASPAQKGVIEQCLKLIEADNDALISMAAVMLYEVGAKEEAISAYQLLASQNPDNPLVHVALGSLYKEVQWHGRGDRQYSKATTLGYDAAKYLEARQVELKQGALAFPARNLEMYVDDAISELETMDFWDSFLTEFVEPGSRNRIDRRQRYSLLQALRTVRGTTPERNADNTIVTYHLELMMPGIEQIVFALDPKSDRWFLRF